MSTTHDLIDALKDELKAAGWNYADLARELGMGHSTVKRMLSRKDMPLSRVDEICRALRIDLADVLTRMADRRPLHHELTLAQERAVVAHRKLLLMASCCLSHWTFEQIVSTYQISETEAIRLMVQLDRLGIIELRPLNRYRLKVARTFRWRPNGPVMAFFREHVVSEYFAGGFEGDDETLLLVHGSIGPDRARPFIERLQKLADEFAQQHLADQRMPAAQRRPYTLLVGMRSWWFQAFVDLWRPEALPPSGP